ncbi:response regulator [Chlorogloeopsis fritschii PCC 9212]|uniref:Response regulator n=1 Tax=Chlorogloeopsis fritschii PCC 6912 TaxID=211165 RepID=A0A433NQW3_CHLFR|nr:response regulator [Chlorogloeopsis fritschii]RUR86559.1 response regulator [Chlorogloeopsis fritschii PCC 6912]
MASHPGQRTILLAEDSTSDLMLVERALSRLDSPVALYVVRNGEEAIAYLQGEREYANRQRYPFPDLVMTNMKMPRITGMELLAWIRQQPELQPLPVVVMSSSNDPDEFERATELHVNSYFVKPLRLEDLVETVRSIVALLPSFDSRA